LAKFIPLNAISEEGKQSAIAVMQGLLATPKEGTSDACDCGSEMENKQNAQ